MQTKEDCPAYMRPPRRVDDKSKEPGGDLPVQKFHLMGLFGVEHVLGATGKTRFSLEDIFSQDPDLCKHLLCS